MGGKASIEHVKGFVSACVHRRGVQPALRLLAGGFRVCGAPEVGKMSLCVATTSPLRVGYRC
jgi:hypothetical protein